MNAIKNLEKSIAGAKSRAKARYYLQTSQVEAAADSLVTRMNKLHVGEGTATSDRTFHLMDLPPPFEVMHCKPLLFDIADNFIQYPNLDSQVEPRQGLGSGLLSWFTG